MQLSGRVSVHCAIILRSIHHGGPIELFPVLASAPQLVQQTSKDKIKHVTFS